MSYNSDMMRLVKLYTSNAYTEEAILEAGDKKTYRKNLSIRDDTWLHVQEIEEEINIKSFFSSHLLW